MVRWEPGTAERLQGAALELFAERGFERTTAADIGAAVGLTERTFFRHFTDKREVLFHGQDRFERQFLDGAAAAPVGAEPMDVVAAALAGAATLFPDDQRARSRSRQDLIEAHPALRERERHKLAGLATSLAQLLVARGVVDLAARLAAESGATVFAVAYAQWTREDEERSLPVIVEHVLGELSALVRPGHDHPIGRDERPASPRRRR